VATPSVIVKGVSKKFGSSLKSALKYGLRDSCRRLVGRDKDHSLRAGEFWALNDVSFTLEPGDALGIMGVNGSGKTTLLRILNGTYGPDTGTVTLRGRIGALIAAGAGFSPMLSGRENIYISGALLGMTPSEIRNKFDEIVAFAELGEFIDMPVRNYSSGMSIRLGFAIAVIAAPEILLVDEVLAVGDISFQKKCFERIYALKREGTSILLVSHSTGSIWAVCNKAIVLHRGISKGITSVEDACKAYEDNNMLERLSSVSSTAKLSDVPRDYGGARGGTGTVCITKVEVLDESRLSITSIKYGASFCLRYHVTALENIEEASLRILIDSEVNKAIAIVDNYEVHKGFLHMSIGNHIYDVLIRRPNLRPGVYFFGAAIIKRGIGVHLFYENNHAQLAITHPEDSFFYADYRASVQLDAEYCGKDGGRSVQELSSQYELP
jgi:lipopolysaccharide transport system ATP-binding protein